MTKRINIGDITLGGRAPLVLIAGPCVIESRQGCLALARRLARLAGKRTSPLSSKPPTTRLIGLRTGLTAAPVSRKASIFSRK